MKGRLTRLTMKPGVSAPADRLLAPRRDQRLGLLDGGRVGGRPGDDLHERHQRRRVEEMESEHTGRAESSPPRSRRPTTRSYSWRGAWSRSPRGRVPGRSPASLRDPRVRLRSTRSRALADDLDRTARRSAMPSVRRPNRRWSRRRGRGDSHDARDRSGCAARPRSIAAALDVVEQDGVPCLDGKLGDPGAHRAGTDDADRARPSRDSRSDELHRFERLAAVAAVVERAALGRTEGGVHDDAGRAAIRAADVLGRARFGDPGGGQGLATGR